MAETKKICRVCFHEEYEKNMKGSVCKTCEEEARKLKYKMSFAEKLNYLRILKKNYRADPYGFLTNVEREQLKICENCEWLRNINYFKLKINCSMPICQKVRIRNADKRN